MADYQGQSIQDLIAANDAQMPVPPPPQQAQIPVDPQAAGANAFYGAVPQPEPPVQAARNIPDMVAQTGQATSTPPQGQEKGGKEAPPASQILDKLMKDLGSTKKSFGPDVFDSKLGGILGSGISPMSAILFGLGAVATRRMPSKDAWGVSMKLMGLPQEYEHAQEQLAQSKVQQAMGLLGMGQKQQELEQKQKEAAAVDQSRAAGQALIAQGGLVPKGFDLATGRLTYEKPEDQITADSAEKTLRGLGIPEDRIAATTAGVMAMPNKQRDDVIKMLEQEHLKSMVSPPKPTQTMMDRDVLAQGQGYPNYESLPQQLKAKIMGDLYGMQAGARAAGAVAGKTTAEQSLPGSAATAGMIRHNPQTNKFEYPGPNDTVESFRNAGGVLLKGPNAAKVSEAIGKEPALLASFNQIKAAALTASQGMLGATLGEYIGGRAGKAAKDYEAEKKIFGQLWDSYYAGARGAASPQLAKLTMDRLPVVGLSATQLGDSPKLAATKLAQMENVIGALHNELAAKVGGRGGTDYAAKTDRLIQNYLGISPTEYQKLINLDIGQGGSNQTPPPPPGGGKAQRVD